MVDVEEESEIENSSNMEGVQREGLFDSQHAPEAGAPDYMTQAGKEKNKGKPQREAQEKKAKRQARIEGREGKGKGKEVVREPGTGANTVPVASRTILKQPDPTRWELMEITRRWKAGNLTKEEMEVASAATAHLTDNEKGESAKAGTIIKAALEALQKWWVASRTRQTGLSPSPETTNTPRASAPRVSHPGNLGVDIQIRIGLDRPTPQNRLEPGRARELLQRKTTIDGHHAGKPSERNGRDSTELRVWIRREEWG
jgi:hypothetical protein